jgi:hypothetical protein
MGLTLTQAASHPLPTPGATTLCAAAAVVVVVFSPPEQNYYSVSCCCCCQSCFSIDAGFSDELVKTGSSAFVSSV